MAKKSEKIQTFPLEINLKVNEELNKDFGGGISSYVEVGPQKWTFPNLFLNEAETFYNFKVCPEDTWIMGYPRSGTTLLQTVIWTILHGFLEENATNKPIYENAYFFETKITHSEKGWNNNLKNSLDPTAAKYLEGILNRFEQMIEDTNRRVIKTHLPFCVLPQDLVTKGAKVIYIARNPKDVAVSYFHLQRMIATRPFVGDFEKYFHYFENNLLCFTPYWEHIKQGWEMQHLENVKFMFYEDFLKDLRGTIKSVATFLDKGLDDRTLDDFEEFFKFDNFKKHDHTAYEKQIGLLRDLPEEFIRKGGSGGWKNYFSEDLNARADKWIERNIANIPGYRLPIIKN